jgi:hypothetical protein
MTCDAIREGVAQSEREALATAVDQQRQQHACDVWMDNDMAA